MDISLIIPAYNEEKRIGDTITKASHFLQEHFKQYEIIVVDDGSEDKTVEIIRKIDDKRIACIALEQNCGKGRAVQVGMNSARGRYCLFTDADLPYRLESILKAIDVFQKTHADVVIGSRDLFKDKPDAAYPLYRKVMSMVFSTYMNVVLGLGITDTQCGFKAFTYEAANIIFPKLTVAGFGFDVELLYVAKKNKMHVGMIPVNLRHTGDSKINIITDSLKMMKDTVKVRINNYKGQYDK